VSDEKIAGTRVPDTPIHRASLWLEEIKYGARREDDPEIEPFELEFFVELIRQCELRDLTPEQIKEAADYYGANMLAMTLGGRVNVMVPAPGGGFMDFKSIFVSTWLDGWMHGVATKAEKVGLSNDEIRQLGGRGG
jgi:hypothetical protein